MSQGTDNRKKNGKNATLTATEKVENNGYTYIFQVQNMPQKRLKCTRKPAKNNKKLTTKESIV